MPRHPIDEKPTEDIISLCLDGQLSKQECASKIFQLLRSKYTITPKRKQIPQAVKIEVWGLYIGKDMYSGKCYVCNDTEIDRHHFECGHVVAVSKGGDNNLTNLRPICRDCNMSMGTQNLEDYRTYIRGLLEVKKD